MVRLLEGDGKTYEWFLITQLLASHCKFSMWSGSIIWDYYKTSVILDKSRFCFVNPRGCVRNLEGIYRFGLPVSLIWLSLPPSVTLHYLKFYPSDAQW